MPLEDYRPEKLPHDPMKKKLRIILAATIAIILLTIISQVGGIILAIALGTLLFTRNRQPRTRKVVALGAFVLLYASSLFIIVPLLAETRGKTPLPWSLRDSIHLRPVNVIYPLLFRNYTTLEMCDVLRRVSQEIYNKFNSDIVYYDACFPFTNWFPLLPHLSHTGGKKVDLGFYYRDKETKKVLESPPSLIGYWAFEQPRSSEYQPCTGKEGVLRWDMAWLQPLFVGAEMDERRTRALLQALLSQSTTQKIFIEPYLKQRMHLSDSRIRFQGCHAARHDDHIHLQIR